MKTHGFTSFEEFWPYYLVEHAHPVNRRLHFAGTSLAILGVVAAVVTGRPVFLLAIPLGGYGFAWVGHFVFQRNRPATFRHPIWSFRGDLRMYYRMWTGRMG